MTELPFSLSYARWTAVDDEADLIERAKRDPSAFAALYRRHYAPIAGYVYRRTGDVHTTEDLVAEVFMTACRSIRQFRCRGVPFRSWLYRIATHATTRWISQHRRRAFDSLETIEAEPAVVDDDRADGDRARRAMWSLSPKHQAVLSLHYLEDLSVEDVAVALGLRIGTVKSRLSRGRTALRAKLSDGRSCYEEK